MHVQLTRCEGRHSTAHEKPVYAPAAALDVAVFVPDLNTTFLTAFVDKGKRGREGAVVITALRESADRSPSSLNRGASLKEY